MVLSSNVQKFGAAAAMSLAAIFGATQATAMETGCRDSSLVVADYEAENQFVLLSSYTANAAFAKVKFTSNSTGSLGYMIEEGVGNAAGKLCVTKYTNIQVNSNDNFSRPSWVNFGASTSFGSWLNTQESQLNTRVLLGATNVIIRDDGTEVLGGTIVVTMSDKPAGLSENSIPIDNIGFARLVDANGRTSSLGTFYNMVPHQSNYARFATRFVQSASLMP